MLLNGPADVNFMMFQNQYGNYFFAIFGALLLIAMLILVVNLGEPILPKKYLNWIRSNGLLLFMIHQSIIGMVGELFPSVRSLPLMISSVIYLIAIHIVSGPVCWLVNRYIPWAAGKKRLKRITD